MTMNHSSGELMILVLALCVAQADMKKVAAVAVAKDPEAAKKAIAALVETNAWKTLATIVRESAPQRELSWPSTSPSHDAHTLPPAAPSVPPRNYQGAGSGAGGQTDAQGFPDIPPEAFDDVHMNDASGINSTGQHGAGAGGAGAGGAGGMVVCPHCTFENLPGSTGDCEVCGLPLA